MTPRALIFFPLLSFLSLLSFLFLSAVRTAPATARIRS